MHAYCDAMFYNIEQVKTHKKLVFRILFFTMLLYWPASVISLHQIAKLWRIFQMFVPAVTNDRSNNEVKEVNV